VTQWRKFLSFIGAFARISAALFNNDSIDSAPALARSIQIPIRAYYSRDCSSTPFPLFVLHILKQKRAVGLSHPFYNAHCEQSPLYNNLFNVPLLIARGTEMPKFQPTFLNYLQDYLSDE
jgi:hypothetical protein